METGEKERGNKKVKVAITAALAFFAAFLVWYTTVARISASRKTEWINTEYGFKREQNPKADSTIFSDSAFIALSRKKAWLQSRTVMAENDSVSLSISLPDSLALLEINGVTVYKARISDFSVSSILMRADEYAINSMLSKPFNIVADISTIEKEPLSHKVAPKDTSEYIPAEIPDTSKKEAVNYIFETDNGFRIYVYQEREGSTKRDASGFFFDLADRFRNSGVLFGHAVRFKIPEYHPYIKITIPRADARIIYRALPRKGQIAFKR